MYFDLRGKRVYVAGHRGMIGAALTRRLSTEDCDILTAEHGALDLRDQTAVLRWFKRERPNAVFLAAARVGGIFANSARPADFIYDNLAIETAVIEASRQVGVEKLLFFGSACMYPRLAAQPLVEHDLLTGPLEPTSQWYAIAKIAGLKLCEAYRRQYDRDFISVIPTNVYGPEDNFDQLTSHVLAALITKIDTAVRRRQGIVEVWGSGRPRREFLYVDDLVDAVVFLMTNWSSDDPINIGTGEDLSIAELAQLVARVVGFEGQFEFDCSKPDGAPRKVLDISKLMAQGWRYQTDLEIGIRQTYEWYLKARCKAPPTYIR